MGANQRARSTLSTVLVFTNVIYVPVIFCVGCLQLLTEQKALCEETAYRKPWTGHVCLQFDDVRQSVFEPVLRHMYTGDVSIPNENELDDIMKLAER